MALYFQTQQDFNIFLFIIFLLLVFLAIALLFTPAWSLLIDPEQEEFIIEKRTIQTLFRPVEHRHNFHEIHSIQQSSDALGLSAAINLRGPNITIAFSFMQQYMQKAPEVLELLENLLQEQLTQHTPTAESLEEEIQFSWWRFRLAALFSFALGLLFVLIWAAGERFFGVDLGVLMYVLGALIGLVILFASGGVNDIRYTALAVGMTIVSVGLMAIYLFFTPSSPYISTGSIFLFVLPVVFSAAFAWRTVRRRNPFMRQRSHLINEDNQLLLSMAASFLILVLVFGFYALTGFAVPEDISAKQAFDQGVELTIQDDLTGAIDAFELALERKPDYVEAQVQIGLAYIDQRQFADAESALQNAIALDANYGLSYYGLGLIESQGQNPESAIQLFTQALDLGIPPGNEELALAIRGLNYVFLDEEGLAFADFDLAVERAEQLDEDDLRARALFFRALGYLTFDQLDLAIGDLNLAFELAIDEGLRSQINELLSEIGEDF
ncbi:MAG: tetratricopeptide repeat protein [Chloroflexi bacterium]|nr:tetratricopeptide repeat protein [Chloroflexota bacterium]